MKVSYPSCYVQGVVLYHRGMYWHAHEAWETCWRKAVEPERTLLRALIQIAAAMVHLSRRNVRGTRALLDRAEENLEGVHGEILGLSVEALREEIRRFRAHLNRSLLEATWEKIRVRPSHLYGLRCGRRRRHPADVPHREPVPGRC